MTKRLARSGLFLVVGCALAAPASAQQAMTPGMLRGKLAAKPSGPEADQLAETVRTWFASKTLASGAAPKIAGLDVAWAIEAPDAAAPPRVVSDDGTLNLSMTRIGQSNLYAAVATLPASTGLRWWYEVAGKKLPRKEGNRPPGAGQLEVYQDPPESLEQPGVPKGKLTQQPTWSSKIFDGTTRDWWVYVPAQYTPEKPACVMVFQDGGGYTAFVPTIFDNLIAKGEMPVTVGVFINPGVFEDNRPNPRNRSFEYDTLSDQYARFLLEEILAEVEKTTKLRQDPDSRAIAGSSSGGICAWTVAWERPDAFRKVLSWVGSFTNIAAGKTLREGGHNYPALIRKGPIKPIRVFLQDGSNDLDNNNGNWPLANQQMAKALAFKGYDYTFAYGQGFHSGKHGQAILPDSLRWLWRDYKP
jgi:enterochelin esterase-like enzyme